MPEWWLNLISPLVTDYCILRNGSEFGCQLNLTLIIVVVPIAGLLTGYILRRFASRKKND